VQRSPRRLETRLAAFDMLQQRVLIALLDLVRLDVNAAAFTVF
jgi:hypothetical protein